MADESGPQRIFDFSPQVLSLTEAVIVGNVNLAIGLETPSCFQPEIKFLVAHADPFF
jgi:NADH/NAD ratio-sensing transcriptional regulator Rex